MTYDGSLLLNENVSATTATNSVKIGERTWNNGDEYIYMYNNGGNATQNYVVALSASSNYAFVQTYASGAGISPTPIGVLKNTSISASAYGWVMVKGFASLYNDGANSVNSGDIVVLSNNGTVRQYSANSTVTQLVFNGVVGKAMASTTNSGLFMCYVNLN